MKNIFGLIVLCLASMPIVMTAQKTNKTQNAKQVSNFATVNAKKITLTTGVEIEYVEQGDPAGIPVILLHGFTDSWRSFAAVLPHLPSSLHVFALSQRGHGNSSKPAGSYKPADFAADVSAFLHQKKIKSAVIVGHSMGSTNAQCFASNYPEQTKALVLVGSFATYKNATLTEFKKVIDELKDPIDSSFIAEFQVSTVTRPIANDMLQGFIHESRKVPAHVWKGVAAGWNSAGFLRSLGSFEKPSLIIWGDKDPYCPREDQMLLKEALKRSTLVVYEGTGHANHWEEPQRFANDLNRFIKTLN